MKSGSVPGRLFDNLKSRLAKNKAAVWLIVGLGNPGAGYEYTRHNAGFRAADAVAQKLGVAVTKKKFESMTGEASFEGAKICIIKPQTFMNLSGEAVWRAMRFYKTGPTELIVIYDDVDLPLGNIRLRAFGGTGSHNGMRSIADSIGGEARFPRIRIGIGQQPKNMELSDYVLQRFKPEERELAETAIAAAADAALDIIRYGIENAMNRNNPKKR